MPDDQKSNDHDLIVEIKTELKLFREESRNINNDTKERLIKLGENKLEKDSFSTFLQGDATFKKDHEARLRRLESWGWMAVGALTIVDALIGWYLATRSY